MVKSKQVPLPQSTGSRPTTSGKSGGSGTAKPKIVKGKGR